MSKALATRPKCNQHGAMELRDPATYTPEQEWCGTWYDCAGPHCRTSAVLLSPALREMQANR